MSARVDADPAALERLRTALLAFVDRQTETLRQIDREVQVATLALDDARTYWEREIERRTEALRECLVSAAFAASQGTFVDCSFERSTVREAEDALVEVLRARDRLRREAEAFAAVEWSYRDCLGSDVPRIDAGLAARAASLNAYLAWRVSDLRVPRRSNSHQPSNLLAKDLSSRLRYGAIKPGLPVERRESRGPERDG